MRRSPSALKPADLRLADMGRDVLKTPARPGSRSGEAWHNVVMAKELTLTPHPIKGSPGWFVQVVFPDGREKRISRFLTKAEAEAWIANEADDWLAGMGEVR